MFSLIGRIVSGLASLIVNMFALGFRTAMWLLCVVICLIILSAIIF